VGTDTRVRVYPNTGYPYRAIALVTSSGGSCTAWFYGPDILATAGHCVHQGAGGNFFTNVRVYPGYDNGGASYPAQFLGTVTGWANSSNEQFDYGIIDIGTNVGNSTGWFGFWWQSASLNNTPAVISGYPGDKSPTSQWVGVDHVRVTQAKQVFYKADTFGGQSGSPVWHDRPAGSSFCSNGPCAYAIHAYGFPHNGAPHNNHNHGTRIDNSVFTNLVNWRNSLP
jgi:glutamyl endopeptidase